MTRVKLSLLRGVCQTPAYVAYEKGFFAEEGIEASIDIAPTAWMVPVSLSRGDSHFAVIPWTRAAAANNEDMRLVVVCGSGHEEAAIVVRHELEVSEVEVVAVPLRGGMKDLTAMALIKSLGWEGAEVRRQPSGDGAIISLFGQGCHAASMVEPYATLMEELGVGRVVRRTGDIWPGAPGCSLMTTVPFRDSDPETVRRVVRAFIRGARDVAKEPAEAAGIAAAYIGVGARFIEQSLHRNAPDVDAIRNEAAVEGVLSLMQELGYIDRPALDFIDLTFLDAAAARAT